MSEVFVVSGSAIMRIPFVDARSAMNTNIPLYADTNDDVVYKKEENPCKGNVLWDVTQRDFTVIVFASKDEIPNVLPEIAWEMKKEEYNEDCVVDYDILNDIDFEPSFFELKSELDIRTPAEERYRQMSIRGRF